MFDGTNYHRDSSVSEVTFTARGEYCAPPGVRIFYVSFEQIVSVVIAN